MLSMGSRKIRVGKADLGIQRAHLTWAQRPSSVCLKAPPLLAQGAVHSAGRVTVAAGGTATGPRDVGDTVALLVHGQVAHVTEKDDVAVLALASHCRYSTQHPQATSALSLYCGSQSTTLSSRSIKYFKDLLRNGTHARLSAARP